MSPDDQVELLREIRDILLEQNRLVDEQMAEYREKQKKLETQFRSGCISVIALAIIVIGILVVRQLQ